MEFAVRILLQFTCYFDFAVYRLKCFQGVGQSGKTPEFLNKQFCINRRKSSDCLLEKMQTSATPPKEKPRLFTGTLRQDIELFPGERSSDGDPTWVIFDPVADTYFRISDENYRIVSALTGNQELDAFMQKLRNSGIAADQDSVLGVLNFLNNSNLMQAVYGSTEAKINKTRDFKRSMFWQRVMSSYLFLRLPLLRPDRFLTRTANAVNTIFSKWALFLLGFVAVIGYGSLVFNWHKFTDRFISSISVRGLLRYSLAVIAIKCIHELAHAYTAKNFGVRVRRMGVAFIVFFPRLFTDLTDSWRVASRRVRFIIDGAGILSETLIGGLAALVWANSSPGTTNTVAYYIFAVSIINTVLINGNPFIRYDGYYMLMDLIGIDNLQQRGIEHARALWRRYLFGLQFPLKDGTTGWKRSFLVFYGICAFMYRLFLYTSIILLVYFRFTKTLGIFLLTMEVYMLIIKPLVNEIRFLIMARKKIRKNNFIISAIGAVVILLLLFMPLPWSVSLPCEIKPDSSEIIYVQNPGFLRKIMVGDGESVQCGQLLMLQDNPLIDWKLQEAKLETEMDRTKIDQAASRSESIGEVAINRQALKNSLALIRELSRKKQLLERRSSIDGQFVSYDWRLQPGKWLQKGEIIGEVFSTESSRLVAYIRENDLKSIRNDGPATFSLVDDTRKLHGRIVSVNKVPAVMERSPLLSVFGGPILCYPEPVYGAYRPIESLYQLDIEVGSSNTKLPIGRTGTVSTTKYVSIGGNIVRSALHILQRELSF